jgi:O-antigen/teichoic acid export membrane protein
LKDVKRFFVHYSHFLMGNIGSVVVGIISFTIFTRILTREEYGIMGLVTFTMFFAVALAKGGISEGIVRYYKENSDSEQKLMIFSSTILARGVLLSIVVFLIYELVFPFFFPYLHLKLRFKKDFMIMGLYLLIRPLDMMILSLLRVKGQTIFLNLLGISGRVLSFGLSLVFMLYIMHRFFGIFIGTVLAEAILFVVLYFWFFSNFKVKLSLASNSLALDLIRFGMPLLITELAYLFLSYTDRYLILYYMGEEAVGVYSVGYNLVSYINEMILFSLSYAIVPLYVEIYEKEGKEKTEAFLTRCLHYLLIGIIPLFFGYAAIAKQFVVLLASEKYVEAASFSPIILLSSLLMAMSILFNAGLYLQKRSRSILMIMVVTAVINIGVNLIIIPRFGILGASWATVVSSFCSMMISVTYSIKILRIRIDPGAVFYHLVLSGVMYAVVSLIQFPNHGINLLAKILMGIAIVVPGVLLKEKSLFLEVRELILKRSLRLNTK